MFTINRIPTAQDTRMAMLMLVLAMAGGVVAQSPNLAGRISGGWIHTLALLQTGTVKSWGHHGYGQLGGVNTANATTPQTIPNLSGVTAVAAGSIHSLALLGNGTVMAWGAGGSGQLGLGNTLSTSTPQVIPNLSGVVAVAAGTHHSLALLSNGTVMSWGWNMYGSLGLGNASATQYNTPQLVPGLTGVVNVAAGEGHNFALHLGGAVSAWGRNEYGQLGLGNTTQQNTAQFIPNLSGVVEIVGGWFHSVARLSNGTVLAWGYNGNGELGLGNTTQHTTPQSIPSLSGVLDVEAGEKWSLALTSGGTVMSWGHYGYGQLGLAYIPSYVYSTPQQIPGLAGVVALGAGNWHSFSIMSDGSTRAWGYNAMGQLGIGNNVSQSTPQLVQGLNFMFELTIAPTNPIGAGSVWGIYSYSPGASYLFDVSLTGSTPGIVIPGAGTIPLNPPLLSLNYGPVLAPYLSNFIGTLDANGSATPGVGVPYSPMLIGTTLTGAALRLDFTSANLIGAISNPALTQLVAPVAALSLVSPSSVPHFGGTPVTIFGSGFMTGAAVSMDGVAAGNVTVLDQWTITCNAPAHAGGTGIVSVTNPGTAVGNWSGQFTWLAPTITSIAPASGGTSGGTMVGIAGTVFHPTATVLFDGLAATGVTVVNDTYITCIAPPHAAGPVDVVVNNPGGVSAFAPAAFLYN